MSKKVKKENATTATLNNEVATNVNIEKEETMSTSTNALTLRDYMEKYPNASLRKLAKVSNINYGVLLTLSKRPIEGEVYNPEATNWGLLDKKFKDKEVDYTTFDWEELNAGPTRHGATLQKDISAFNVGDKVYLRRDNTTPYEILYKTETHVVIMKVGTSEPQAWANNTFLINGPVFEPRAQKSEKVEVEVEETKNEE